MTDRRSLFQYDVVFVRLHSFGCISEHKHDYHIMSFVIAVPVFSAAGLDSVLVSLQTSSVNAGGGIGADLVEAGFRSFPLGPHPRF